MDLQVFGMRNVIENDIDGDPTPKDQAIYVPSVSAGYARDAIGRAGLRAMPGHLPKNLLNFLDQTNEVFRISHGEAHFWTIPDILKEPQLERIKF